MGKWYCDCVAYLARDRERGSHKSGDWLMITAIAQGWGLTAGGKIRLVVHYQQGQWQDCGARLG